MTRKTLGRLEPVDHFREGADLQPDGFSVPSYS